jgi:hypothetical protein
MAVPTLCEENAGATRSAKQKKILRANVPAVENGLDLVGHRWLETGAKS